MSLRKPQSEISALTFTQLPGAAVYVAASPDGTFWVLSTQGLANGDKFIYHYVGNGNYVNVPGAASRIAVGPDGTPWVLNGAGGIYHLVNGLFEPIAGGASEISVGGTASAPLVDVISNQSPGPFGSGIYQYNVNAGTWSQLPGAGVTVAASIDPGTYPALNINPGGFYVTNAAGGIYYYNVGVGFEQLPGGAVSLAPTATGGLFALGNPGSYPHGIYYNDLNTGMWTQMPGAAISLSANGTDVFAIGAAGGIYESPITAAASPTPSPTATPSPAATPLNPNYSYFNLLQPGLQITSLQTTITVPPQPPAFGFISLWPGLDNAEAIASGDNILHQPILQWGGVCTNANVPQYASWVAEAFYYRQNPNAQQATCNGGIVISVNPADTLTETIALTGSTWNQTVTDNNTGQSSTYSYSAQSLNNQYPDRINFAIEIWNTNGFNNMIPAVVFSNTTATANAPFTTCALESLVYPVESTTGSNSTTTPVSSNGGKTCSWLSITLYPVAEFAQPSSIERARAPYGI